MVWLFIGIWIKSEFTPPLIVNWPLIVAVPVKGKPTPSPEAARDADVNVAPPMCNSEALMWSLALIILAVIE